MYLDDDNNQNHILYCSDDKIMKIVLDDVQRLLFLNQLQNWLQ